MTDEDRIALINDMAANGVALVDDMRFMLAQLAKAKAEKDKSIRRLETVGAMPRSGRSGHHEAPVALTTLRYIGNRSRQRTGQVG